MNRIRNTWIAFLFLGICGSSLQAAENPPLLREGLEFTRVEGTARINERTKAWRFVTHKTLRDSRITIPTGTELTILPGSTLDKIIAYAGKDDFISIRIDAVVTRYHDANFLFVFDAAPLRDIPQEQSPEQKQEPQQTPKEEKINIIKMATDPNETSVIPSSILKRMKPKQKTDFSRMQEVTKEIDAPGDSMIVNRTGQFAGLEKTSEFVLDGFGQNISGRSFALLPCRTLEYVESQLCQSFGRERYRVSGIITTFRGKKFLLLQGAVRTYTNGNFTP